MHNNENEFYSWLAGFIDADGCFYIGLYNVKHNNSLNVRFKVIIDQKYPK